MVKQMSDIERETCKLTKRDQNHYNAFMEIADMIRMHIRMSETERKEQWIDMVIKDIKDNGLYIVGGYYIEHYQIAIRINRDMFELFRINNMAWQPAQDEPYPKITKAKLNKPIIVSKNLNEIYEYLCTNKK